MRWLKVKLKGFLKVGEGFLFCPSLARNVDFQALGIPIFLFLNTGNGRFVALFFHGIPNSSRRNHT